MSGRRSSRKTLTSQKSSLSSESDVSGRRSSRRAVASQSSSLVSESEASHLQLEGSESVMSFETPSTSTGISATPSGSEIFSVPSTESLLHRELLRYAESDTSSTSGRSLRSGRTSAASSRGSSKSRGSSSHSSSGNESTSAEKWSISGIDEISGEKLPSNEQVIGFYIHLRRTNPIMHAARIVEAVYDELVRFYRNIGIPTKSRKEVEKQISQLYTKYQNMKDIRNRRRAMYDTEKINLAEFIDDLENLFDISLPDGQVDVEEYRQFLENQRLPGRIGNKYRLLAVCLFIV